MTRHPDPSALLAFTAAAASSLALAPAASAQATDTPSPHEPVRMHETSPHATPTMTKSPSPTPDSSDAATAADDAKDLALGDRLSVSLGVDFTNSYYFRGLLQERHKFITQPYASIEALVAEPDPFSLSLSAGMWNSFHDVTTGVDTSENDLTDHWYEADWWIGATLSTGPWSLNAQYVWYTSPADVFNTAEEVLLTLAYDDSSWWGTEEENPHAFSLSPAIQLGIETENAADGQDEGIFFSPMLTPGFNWNLPLVGDTRFDFPLVLGISLDDYYQDADGDDDSFGFFSAGVKTTISLPVPKGFGEWSLSSGVALLVLDGNTEIVNDNDDTEVIATVSLGISF